MRGVLHTRPNLERASPTPQTGAPGLPRTLHTCRNFGSAKPDRPGEMAIRPGPTHRRPISVAGRRRPRTAPNFELSAARKIQRRKRRCHLIVGSQSSLPDRKGNRDVLSWGVVIAGCALAFGLGAYLDTYFIASAHKDRVRLALISVYMWISRTRLSFVMFRFARALSSLPATYFYMFIGFLMVLGSVFLSYRRLLTVVVRVTTSTRPYFYDDNASICGSNTFSGVTNCIGVAKYLAFYDHCKTVYKFNI